MPEISYDSRSLAIDGRRIWLVSGSVDYARTPHGLWRRRIRAAKQAGLNCIETGVYWNAHERQPGVFDFEGDLDLRAFVQMVGEEGLYCILRPGPFVASGWDLGGLPAYLHGVTDKKGTRPRMRQNEPLFMEAVDRYLRAVMEQVGDLQIASPRLGPRQAIVTGHAAGRAAGGYRGDAGGPIVLMQVENQWHCDNPQDGAAYHQRLVSMMRQQGCVVPIINGNNLWQPVEGTIDTWQGSSDLPAMMRQLASIQPQAPPMVMAFGTATQTGTDTDTTAHQADELADDQADDACAQQLGYRIAGLLGVGAQFNLRPFHGRSNIGFFGGRTLNGDTSFVAPGNNEAPLGQAGERASAYAAVKRLCLFASHFGHVLAACDSIPTPAIALNETDHPTALLHQRGGQGELIMLIKSPKDKTKHTELILPSGLTLDVPHAGQRAAWVLLDTNLGGICTLNYTSLSPWALADRSLLVVFGPASAQGVVSIDGQHHAVTVPSGKTPTVIRGDPVHLVVLNQEQIDATYLGPEGVYVGCNGLDENDAPIALPGWASLFTITSAGRLSRKRITPCSRPTDPRLSKWQALSLKTLVQASDKSYTAIDGPASLGQLGQPLGYGWYRFTNKKPIRGDMLLPCGGDRLHLYQQGKLTALLGRGAGATNQPTPLKLSGDVAVLADNLGRFCEGQEIGKDLKGLASHLYTVKPIMPDKPQRIKQPAGDPFAIETLAQHQRVGALPMSEALAWTIKPKSRKPIILEIKGLAQPCVISVNDEPLRYYAADLSASHIRILLDPADDGPMTGGKNLIKLELLKPLAQGIAIDEHLRFFQTTGQATPNDGWGFSPWTIPSTNDARWRNAPKSLPSQPTWLRCTFDWQTTDAPLWLEPHGMSKGQIILNGHNVGRYWQQTREGKQVGPQERYYLPEPWLNVNEPNVLMLFDEHGRTPGRCRLVYGR